MSIDQQPVRRLAEVDDGQAEQNDFFRVTAPRLVKYLGRVKSIHNLSDTQLDMENIAYEAIARTLENWPEVKQPNAYAFRVAKNLVAARTSEPTYTYRDPQDLVESRLPAGGLADPVDKVLEDELFGLVNQLPPQQRAATFLRHIEKVPSAEIAAELGCHPSAVDVHAHKGKLALRRMYKVFAGVAAVVAAICGIDRLLLDLETRQGEPPTAKGVWDLVGLALSTGFDGFALVMVIVGGLLVALGIGAIVLLLHRRDSGDLDDDDQS